jgi:hypothetical protein
MISVFQPWLSAGRLVAARACADFDKGGARIVGVFGQQHALQFTFQSFQLGAGAGDFFFGHLAHFFVRQQGLRSLQILAAQLVPGVARGHGADLGMLARELQELRHVAHDVFTRQQKVQLMQPQGVALKLGF